MTRLLQEFLQPITGKLSMLAQERPWGFNKLVKKQLDGFEMFQQILLYEESGYEPVFYDCYICNIHNSWL